MPIQSFIKYPEIVIRLTGEDGNTFNILSRCRRALRLHYREHDLAGCQEVIDRFIAEATAGDYEHLLATCMRWFDVH